MIRSEDLYVTSNKVRSEPITVLGAYDLVFRLLTTDHRRAVHNKAAGRNQSPVAYEDDVRVLTLARALATLNGMPLRLDPVEVDAVRKSLGLRADQPFDAVDEAEVILTERFTIRVLREFDEAYANWIDEYDAQAIEEVKKKLGRVAPGITTSASAMPGASSPTTPASTI